MSLKERVIRRLLDERFTLIAEYELEGCAAINYCDADAKGKLCDRQEKLLGKIKNIEARVKELDGNQEIESWEFK
jgi:hypothetical protein